MAFARLRGAAGALTPAGILAAPRASLTAAGLSGAKADVIRNLAGWFAANRRIAETLPALRDDEDGEASEHAGFGPGLSGADG